MIIAIDGPAGSGKTTTAKLVAERLGYTHLDTGAMYRAVAEKVLRLGINPDDSDAVSGILGSTTVELKRDAGSLSVYLDGEDVSKKIRTVEVTRAVSAVSRIPAVRQAMVAQQRNMGRAGGVVLEGRDIGTVVFPDADVKVFMVAGLEARARRRKEELQRSGNEVSLVVLMREIDERDHKDSTRQTSPLQKADDAIELDTSALTIEEQVEFVVKEARKRQMELGLKS